MPPASRSARPAARQDTESHDRSEKDKIGNVRLVPAVREASQHTGGNCNGDDQAVEYGCGRKVAVIVQQRSKYRAASPGARLKSHGCHAFHFVMQADRHLPCQSPDSCSLKQPLASNRGAINNWPSARMTPFLLWASPTQIMSEST